MGFIRTAIIGAAIYSAYKYITKPDQVTGRTIVDDLQDKAPEWIEKAKSLKNDLQGKYLNDDVARGV